MTYEQFIEEITALIAQGETFAGAVEYSGDRRFRDWRRHAESITQNIRAEGYVLPGAFASPGRPYGSINPMDAQVSFNRDMEDSLGELRYIVRHFEKYGAPRLPGARAESAEAMLGAPAGASAPLMAPAKVTFRWMIDNVSLKGWLAVGATAAALFIGGFMAAQIPAGRVVVCWFKPDACPAPNPATAQTASRDTRAPTPARPQ